MNAPASAAQPVQKMHQLPASNFTLHRDTGERSCRHCEGNDPHCSLCEGVGTLPGAKATGGAA